MHAGSSSCQTSRRKNGANFSAVASALESSATQGESRMRKSKIVITCLLLFASAIAAAQDPKAGLDDAAVAKLVVPPFPF